MTQLPVPPSVPATPGGPVGSEPARTGGRGTAFGLLPAVYRERDAQPDGGAGFLRELVGLVEDELALVHDDIDQLYEDLFVETCAAWVLPYLGDLVAVTPGAPLDRGVVLTRGAVADAIPLRRRKGTASALADLAHDLTGWPARAVEVFEHLAVTRSVRLPERPQLTAGRKRGRTADLRSALEAEQALRRGSTPEVRRIGSGRGRYGVRNVAVLVWRDVRLPRTWVDAAAVDDRRFRFSPLGVDGPLATTPRTGVGTAGGGRLTRRAVAAEPGVFLGTDVLVRPAGAVDPVAVGDVVVCDLGDAAAGGWSNVARLPATAVGIDPERGRLAFGSAQPAPPRVTFTTTAPSDVGGSELADPPDLDAPRVTTVGRAGTGAAATSVAGGLAASGGVGVVEVEDSGTYDGDLTVAVPPRTLLAVTSARGAHPLVRLASGWVLDAGEGSVVVLDGLTIGGGPVVVRGRPDRVEISRCTLVPGYRLTADAEAVPPVGPSLVLAVDSDWQTEVTVRECVTGPLHVPADGNTLTVTDSVVDAVGRDGVPAGTAPPGARVVPVVRSSTPLGALPLPTGPPRLAVRLGGDAPIVVALPGPPTDAATAAADLDAALTGTGARAVVARGRVVVVGDGRPVAVETTPGEDLAAVLGLVGPGSTARAVLGEHADVPAAAGGGTVTVTTSSGDRRVTVAAGAVDATGLAGLLEAGLDVVADLAGTAVVALGDRLLVLPTSPQALTVTVTADDRATAHALGLVSPRPAVAADAAGTPSAALTLDRCTVLGQVTAESLTVIDSIVTGPLRAERRQVGCVRHSWVAPGSATPARDHCRSEGPETPPPRFVSRRYATPGYGRLRRAGATALVRGASDGYEMGAHARLGQTQRDDNLRRGIAESLRFGLEAGVLDAD
ncbi:hypothetical protein [Kineococcus aurantiacus]|uniref:Phage tail-like protein n=1 Tax=Kineococcus aurantiacus TaxID=37633 RepID=A0A7Y9DQ05_9ACTN|nr:hypothetical protein [Kineococcus aurantiacus]NYD24675.1 phage tail-like protein [Kineococcus aurantiacus]